MNDVVVVGSGMSAAHAAQTLVEAGREVLMLDAGQPGARHTVEAPDQDFLSLRERDPDQHRYFLGPRFEGIPWGPAANTLTPPRAYIAAGTDRWCPIRSESFHGLESLAYGGLGNGWGAGCAAYPDIELEAMGLDVRAVRGGYAEIARRIGVAARRDDASRLCAEGIADPQEPLRLDASIRGLHDAYARHRETLRARGLVMGKDPMAVLTRPELGRDATAYRDMEFWNDQGRAVYRPWMTLDALRAGPRFRYEGGLHVLRIEERGDQVSVTARPVAGGADVTFAARRVVLAAGALGTARIVLRSGLATGPLPLLSNAYAVAACLHLRMVGRVLERERTSLGQLEMFHDPRGDGLGARMVSLYTYRSLLLFKLVKEAPFAMSDALPILRALSPALILATHNHPDRPGPGKRCLLLPDAASATGDALHVEWSPAPGEAEENAASERAIAWGLGRLGAPVVRTQHLPPGSTVHYAGTLPFAEPGDDDRPGRLAPDGRLGGTARVFVADGSGFRYLPANGHTFTLMANAHRVAARLAAGARP